MTETLKIELPLYRDRLHVFFGTLEECKQAMLKDGEPEYKVEDWAEHTDGLSGMYSQNKGYRLLWLPHLPMTIDDYGCLVHEIEHAVFNILLAKGITHTEEDDEVYAYLTGFLFSEIDAFIVEERYKLENTNQTNNNMETKIERYTTDEAIKLADEGNRFLDEVLKFCPNNLGINLCSVESITIEREDDEKEQLVNLSIKFIPYHGEE